MQADTHAFIVRIWQEAAHEEGQAGVWRGSIEAVGNGPRQYFSDLQGMVCFIQEQIGLEVRPHLSIWHRTWSRLHNGIRSISKRFSS